MDEKARSVEMLCEPVAGRALYLAIENALFPTLYSKLNFYLDLTLPLSLNCELALYFIGSTVEEAVREVLIAKATWLEAAASEGKPIPEPRYRPAIYKRAS